MGRKTGAEHWFFLAFVASLPFASVLQIRAFSIPLHLSDLLFLAAATAWAAAWAAGRKTPVRSRWYAFLASYAVAVVLSAIFSADPARSSVKLVGKFYLIGVAILTLNSIASFADLRRTIHAWLIGAGISLALSLAGIVLFYAGSTDPSSNLVLHPIFGSLPSGRYPRIEGFFSYPAMLCSFLGVTWMFLLLCVSAGWIKARSFWPFATVLLIVNAFTLTPGLGGIFLSTAGFLRSRIFGKMRPIAGRLSIAVGIVVAAAFLTAASVTLFSYDPGGVRVPLLEGTVSPSHRAGAWRTGLETFLRNPVFGYGVGLPVSRSEYVDPSGNSHLLADAHNTYVSVLGETGSVGLITFVGLIAYLTLSLFYWRPQTNTERAVRLCLLLAMLDAFFYQGLTGSYEDTRHLWVFLGIAAAVRTLSKLPSAFDETEGRDPTRQV